MFFKIIKKYQIERSVKILIYPEHKNLDNFFNLETNSNYKRKKIVKINKLKKIIENYNIKGNYEYYKIQKINSGSIIYCLINKKYKFILRSALDRESTQLEEQCLIASKIKPNLFVRPLRNKNKFFVTRDRGLSYIIYKKIGGKIYNGDPQHLESILKKAIIFSKELKIINKKNFVKLNKNKYNPHKDIQFCKNLLNKNFINILFKKKYISLNTKKIIFSNEDFFKWNINIFKQINLKKENLIISHNDFNHSNIVISGKNVKFIDIEDVCIDYKKQIIGHLFFKIIRHSLYENKVSLKNLKKKHMSKLFKIILSDNKIYKSKYDLHQFCVLRILSDIARILKFYKLKKDKKYMYDLEKKIHNLFEVYYILY